LLGGLFVLAAVAVAGLPPLSGFIGKVLFLRSAFGDPAAAWIFAVVLAAGFLTLIAVSRAGSMVFWNVADDAPQRPGRARGGRVAAIVVLLGLLVAMSAFAGPLAAFTDAIAAGLLHPDAYVEAVFANPGAGATSAPHGGGGQ
jgi:multicomponent K+:H+ antiporter subunit D